MQYRSSHSDLAAETTVGVAAEAAVSQAVVLAGGAKVMDIGWLVVRMVRGGGCVNNHLVSKTKPYCFCVCGQSYIPAVFAISLERL